MQPLSAKKAHGAAGGESMVVVERALEAAVRSFRRELGRDPYIEELEHLFHKGLKSVKEKENLKSRDAAREQIVIPSRRAGRPAPHEPSESQDQACDGVGIRRITTIEEARGIAREMVRNATPYRILSCEMRVTREDGQVALREDQVLSDGTKAMGRFFAFESDEEAVESITRILWESAENQEEDSQFVVLRKADDPAPGRKQ